MSLTIKFPTLITEPEKNGVDNQLAMIQNAQGIFERYNNRNIQDLLVISTRGKTKEKVIKEVNTSSMTLGDDHCLLLKVEEYKQGYDDLYLESEQQSQDITSSDKLGSRYNYAMMYPYINHDDNGHNINRWIVFIYASPDKEDGDLINTIKSVISKILNLRFLNVIHSNLITKRTYPWVSVLLSNVENVDNKDLQFNQYVVTVKEKATKEVLYQNVPNEEAEQLRSNSNIEEGFSKKIVKLFTSEDKKSYLKYEYESDSQGAFSSKLMEKYSCSIDVSDNIDTMYNAHFMEQCFLRVLEHFLANE